MKLAIATLLVGSAAAFSPAATVSRNSALSMSTATEEKVRHRGDVSELSSCTDLLRPHNANESTTAAQCNAYVPLGSLDAG